MSASLLLPVSLGKTTLSFSWYFFFLFFFLQLTHLDSVWLAAVIGFLTAVVCALCQNINTWLRIDEGLYVFKLHGIGGMVGSLLTGIFANQAVSALDGVSLYPGGINGNGVQVGKQFAEITAISVYSFTVSCILLMAIKYIPGMHLRVSEEAEMNGLDLDQFFDEQIGEWELYTNGGIDANGQHIVVQGIHQKDMLQGSQTPESHEASVEANISKTD